VEAREQLEESVRTGPAETSGTLGAVLYRIPGKRLISETEWAALVVAVAAGDQLALHALYERAHRMVFTLAMRINHSRETAEEVTLDVFHDVWRRAAQYHPANGTVLGWIMNQARSRAIDRLRFEQRKKRVDPYAANEADGVETLDPSDVLQLKQEGEAVRTALSLLAPAERRAVEAAFLGGLTHAEIASQLGEPLGTIKTRIRSGLKKLRESLDLEGRHR
jgi:RNA polymerase sigma-70 factor, ECF subfamily